MADTADFAHLGVLERTYAAMAVAGRQIALVNPAAKSSGAPRLSKGAPATWPAIPSPNM